MQTLHKAVSTFSRFAKLAALAIAASTLVFGLIHLASLSLLAETGRIVIEHDALLHLLSVNMLPMVMAYLFLVAVLYYLYRMARAAIAQSAKEEIELARREATVATLQKVTGVIAEELVPPNTELRRYIELKKRKGQAPPALETASGSISTTLRRLTWLSYVLPHLETDATGDDALTIIANAPAHTTGNPLLLPGPVAKRRQ